jgi:hypothetical protein
MLIISLCIFTCDADAQNSNHLDYLLNQARQKELHNKRYWHILLHYQQNILGTKSLIDDPDFFLSSNGKFDPGAELEASIKTFFRKDAKETDLPICRFIARYTWLKEQLDFDGLNVPLFECKKVDQVNPKSATLVFPTYYMNNPASMFGHTLINIETDYSNPLLAKSVNYSALTKETNGILFAIKGLFGFYKGYYSVLPYYMKIQQYSDISQRDIWEYRLNLSVVELERMVRHIRELEDIYADYFFFDENCSYNLLYLLEAARPSVRLTDKFSLWTIPIDTIREVEKAGLIESAVFRPSKASKIRHKISLMDANSIVVAKKIINGKTDPASILDLDITREEKILILDFVTDYTGYRYAKKKITEGQYQKVLLNALKLRSKLGKRDQPYRPTPPLQPDRGHGSMKFSAELGVNTGESFLEIGIRPAFSDLLDNNNQQGMQIEFFDTRLRYYFSDDKFVLDSFDIIDIVSISPMDKFFKPLSWKVQAGAYREIMADGRESAIFRLNTGGGLSYDTPYLGLCYIFIVPEFQYGVDLEKDFALGGGISIGATRDMTDWWKFHISVRQIYFELGDDHHSGKVALLQNFVLSKNNHIRVDVSREKTFSIYNTEAGIRWCRFF